MTLTFSNAGNIAANAKRLGVTYADVEAIVGNALETAKEAVRKGVAEYLYTDVTVIVSKLVRTAIVAPPGFSLVPCDFKNIEARILAWVAGEEWVLDAYRRDEDLYAIMASRMFNIPLELITKDSEARKKGKISVLALGYQGGEGALVNMGSRKEGIPDEDLPAIVTGYRVSVPKIKGFWKLVEKAARYAIKNKSVYILRLKYTSLKFTYEKGYLFITLPSGRRIAYFGAHVAADGYRMRYWGYKQDADKTVKLWTTIDLYGGIITENIVQAIARDCLVEAMYRMRNNLLIVMHIHDEIVAEVADDRAKDTLVYMEQQMSINPLWANGLPLGADGYVSKYYRKD